MNKIKVKKALADDLFELQEIAQKAYKVVFAHHWKEGGMSLYL